MPWERVGRTQVLDQSFPSLPVCPGPGSCQAQKHKDGAWGDAGLSCRSSLPMENQKRGVLLGAGMVAVHRSGQLSCVPGPQLSAEV